MKKLIITLIILTLTGCSQPQNIEPVPIEQPANLQVLNEIEIVEPDIPIYDIPMSKELQEYTFELCREYNLSYELVLAVMHTESRFDPNADSGNSKGICQISRGTGDWVSEQAGIRDFDPYNPKHNIAVGIWYLDYLRSYWWEQGCLDQDVFSLMLISYNRGIQGCKNYVEKHGLNNDYVTKVYEYKTKLEQQNLCSLK
jgi:membrane-bound lytic murein transglycosylase MltF